MGKYFRTYYSKAFINEKMALGPPIGPLNSKAPSHCVLKWGFTWDIFWESRCNIEMNVWAHFLKILLVFEVPYGPRVKMMPGKR